MGSCKKYFKGGCKINKALWDEFINGKVAVNCRTENQAKKFLKICDAKGLIWCDGHSLSNLSWNIYEGATCYICGKEGLSWCNIDYFKCSSYKVITFKQLIKPDKPKEDKQEQFKGWQILKMIEEGKLKDDDILAGKNGSEYKIRDIRSLDYLQAYQPFTIKSIEKHYLTFDEARRTGKKFKYKGWKDFISLSEFMNTRFSNDEEAINGWLDERAWEVEE